MTSGIVITNSEGQVVLDTTQRVLKGISIATVTENVTVAIPYTPAAGSSSILAVPIETPADAPIPVVSVGGGNVNVSWGVGQVGSASRKLVFLEY